MNRELLKPANLLAIAIISIIANKLAYTLFTKHAVDERAKPRI